jgi:hypothetical protein
MDQWMIEATVGDMLDDCFAGIEPFCRGLRRVFLNLRVDLHVST